MSMHMNAALSEVHRRIRAKFCQFKSFLKEKSHTDYKKHKKHIMSISAHYEAHRVNDGSYQSQLTIRLEISILVSPKLDHNERIKQFD